MKQLVIIGARGFGREVCTLARQCVNFGKDFTLKGFLDNKSNALDGFTGYPPVLSSVEDYTPDANDVFACALGDVKWKAHYSDIILRRGGEFINLIHPSTTVSPNVKLGKGLIIFGHSYIGNDTSLSDLVTIQGAVQIGHDVTIGRLSHFNAFAFVGGYCTIGERVTLNVKASVIPRIKLDDDVSVGAHSLVIKNPGAGASVFGTPAKKMEF